MRAMRMCMVGLAVALAGCATARPQTSVPAAPVRADEAPEERQIEGWPPYYPPRLVRDLAGTDAVTGEATSIERGYVLHRIDLEKVRVLDARAARCDQDLGVCEQRVAHMAATPSFWDSSAGRVLPISLGFLVGMGATVGVAILIE